MDVELRDALTQGFGPEPAHRPLGDRLEAGQRAVRRRRITGAVLTVAVASVVGLGAVAVLDAVEGTTSQVATNPNLSEEELWGRQLARYSADGVVAVRPGVTVLHRIAEPLGDDSDYDRSVALAVEWRGSQTWLMLTWESDPNSTVSTSEAGTPADGSFADWVEQQVAANEDDSGGVVHFAADGSLVSAHGVEILDQVLDPPLKDFVLNGEPSAAALLQGPDGKKWYVLVRDIDGLETISTPFRTGGADLEAFIDYAREKYASGEGLR